jgi:beta-glucosidase
VSPTIRNSGARDSAEVAQFYLSDIHASTIVPLHHLIGFERVTLRAGQSRTLKFTITSEMMSFYNEDEKLTLEPGEFRLEVGGWSPSKRGQDIGVPKPVVAMSA